MHIHRLCMVHISVLKRLFGVHFGAKKALVHISGAKKALWCTFLG